MFVWENPLDNHVPQGPKDQPFTKKLQLREKLHHEDVPWSLSSGLIVGDATTQLG